MTTDGAATSPIRNPSARIDFDLACVKCDYNLRTRPTDGVCPECATPISDALRPDRLCFADMRWLGRIRNGMGVALWTAAAIFASMVATQSFLRLGWLFLVLLTCFCVLLTLWALFLITTPDPNRPARDRALRIACVASALCAGLFAGGGLLSLTWARIFSGQAMAFAYGLSTSATRLLVSLYLRRLARRGDVKGLTKMMTALVWGAVAVILLGTVSTGTSIWLMRNLVPIAPAPVPSTGPAGMTTYNPAAGSVTVTTATATARAMPPGFAFVSDLSLLFSIATAIATLAYGITAIGALVWFRRALAAVRAGPDPSATMSP